MVLANGDLDNWSQRAIVVYGTEAMETQERVRALRSKLNQRFDAYVVMMFWLS